MGEHLESSVKAFRGRRIISHADFSFGTYTHDYALVNAMYIRAREIC